MMIISHRKCMWLAGFAVFFGLYGTPLARAADTARTDGWIYHPLGPDSHCLGAESGEAAVLVKSAETDGVPTPSDDLLIYMEGGGSCSKYSDCFPSDGRGPANVDGYSTVDFENESKLGGGYLYLDPNAARNPFRRMNMAMVPYCTGDLHAGTRIRIHPTIPARNLYFYGSINFVKALDHIASTFPDVKKVWLMGTSAGGAGAAIQFEKVREKFKGRGTGWQVHLIEDSSPGFPKTGDTDRFVNWGATLPCAVGATCTQLQDTRLYNRGLNAAFRYAFISFSYDLVTNNGLNPADFKMALDGYVSQVESANPSKSRHMYADNTGLPGFPDFPKSCQNHVVTSKSLPDALQVAHSDFLASMVNNVAWNTVNYVVPSCPSGDDDAE